MESLLSFKQLWYYFKPYIISEISFTLRPQLFHWEVVIIIYLDLTAHQLILVIMNQN